MKKRHLLFVTSIIVVLSLTLTGCGGSTGPAVPPTGNPESPGGTPATAPPAQVITLKFSYPMPELSFYGDTYGYLGKCIEEESGGTIKVEMYPAATLAGDTEILDAVSRGNIDMGHFFSTYLSPTIPNLLPLEVPGVYPGEEYEKLNTATFDIVDRIISEYGLKFVALSFPDTIAISSTKNIIKSPSDMGGITVRSSGKWGGEAMMLWGASPATIPIGDVATALERGTIDACYTSWMMTSSYKFYETAPKLTFTKLQNSYYGVMMNEQKWDSLSSDQQEAFKRAADKFRSYSQEVYNNLQEMFLETLTGMGAEYYILNDEENSAFTDKSLTLLPQIEKLVSEDGLALNKALTEMREG